MELLEHVMHTLPSHHPTPSTIPPPTRTLYLTHSVNTNNHALETRVLVRQFSPAIGFGWAQVGGGLGGSGAPIHLLTPISDILGWLQAFSQKSRQ